MPRLPEALEVSEFCVGMETVAMGTFVVEGVAKGLIVLPVVVEDWSKDVVDEVLIAVDGTGGAWTRRVCPARGGGGGGGIKCAAFWDTLFCCGVSDDVFSSEFTWEFSLGSLLLSISYEKRTKILLKQWL